MECCGDEDGWHSDDRSRGLSHHSTGIDAGGLDFRVRDGTGYYPSAVAVHTASSNLMNREAYWTEAHLWLGCNKIVKIARGVSAAGLNTSANLGAYTRCLSNSSSTSPPEMPRLSDDFELRCFQLLSIGAWLPSIALPDNW